MPLQPTLRHTRGSAKVSIIKKSDALPKTGNAKAREFENTKELEVSVFVLSPFRGFVFHGVRGV